MKKRCIRAFILGICLCMSNNDIAMEEQKHPEKPEQKKTLSARSVRLSPRRKSLGNFFYQSNSFPQMSIKKSGTLNIRSRNIFTTKSEHEELLGPYPYLLIPYPFYFTSIKQVEDYINDLIFGWKKDINYQDEDGKTCAHYVFDLHNKILFERPLFRIEKTEENIEEAKENEGNNEKNIEFRPLPPEQYFDLQYKFIKLLMECKDIDLTLQDHQHYTPFTYLIHSLLDTTTESEDKKIQQEHIERQQIKKAYIPKIFQLIISHGYHSLFKNELFLMYTIGDLRLENIKHLLSPLFPLYTSLPNIKEFISNNLSTQKQGINTQDESGMTLLHYLLLLNEKLLLDRSNLNTIARLIEDICTRYQPDFTIRNAIELTPIDCLFFSLLNFKPEQHSPTQTITISTQRSSEESHVDISSTQLLPTKKQTPIKPIIRIFEHIMRVCPQFIKNTFDKLLPNEKYRIESFISFFPVFIKVARLKKLFEKNHGIKRILKTIDNDGNNYVHYLADLSNQFPLFENTPENRLDSIQCVVNHKFGKRLFTKKNKDGKLPLEVFIESLPDTVLKYAINKQTYHKILSILAQSTHAEHSITAALESPFPFFLTTQRLAKKLEQESDTILNIIDNQGNTLLHCLANFSNKHILLCDTPATRLKSIELVLNHQSNKKLSCQKNNSHKLPLDLFLKRLRTIDQNNASMEIYQKILSILIRQVVDEDGNNYLHHLAQLSHKNCLSFISIISNQEQGKELACQRNKHNKLPLELLFTSFLNKLPLSKEAMQENFRVATVCLAQLLAPEEIVPIVNGLSEKDFKYLRKIISGRYHTREESTVTLLRRIINFRASTM